MLCISAYVAAMDVADIIKQAGGASAVAAASRKTRKSVNRRAVYDWAIDGVPDWQVSLVSKLSGVPESEIREASEVLRRKRKKKSRGPLASRVAA